VYCVGVDWSLNFLSVRVWQQFRLRVPVRTDGRSIGQARRCLAGDQHRGTFRQCQFGVRGRSETWHCPARIPRWQRAGGGVVRVGLRRSEFRYRTGSGSPYHCRTYPDGDGRGSLAGMRPYRPDVTSTGVKYRTP